MILYLASSVFAPANLLPIPARRLTLVILAGVTPIDSVTYLDGPLVQCLPIFTNAAKELTQLILPSHSDPHTYLLCKIDDSLCRAFQGKMNRGPQKCEICPTRNDLQKKMIDKDERTIQTDSFIKCVSKPLACTSISAIVSD